MKISFFLISQSLERIAQLHRMPSPVRRSNRRGCYLNAYYITAFTEPDQVSPLKYQWRLFQYLAIRNSEKKLFEAT